MSAFDDIFEDKVADIGLGDLTTGKRGDAAVATPEEEERGIVNQNINPAFREEPVPWHVPVDVFGQSGIDPPLSTQSPAEQQRQQGDAEFVNAFMNMDADQQKKLLLDDDVGNPIFKQITNPLEQDKFINDINEDRIMIAALFASGGIPPDTPEFTMAQNIYLTTEPWFKPASEIAALTAGGIFGAPAGPFGSVGLAALGYAAVRNIWGFTKTLLGLEEPQSFLDQAQETARDIQQGALFEGGGQVGTRILSATGGAIKRNIIDPIARRSTLTDIGAKQRASDIITKQTEGTPVTQPQIEENIRLAKELQDKIRKEVDPEFTFTFGQLTDDASTVALERTLAGREGVDISQAQREAGTEALRTYYHKKVLSTGTPEDLAVYMERMSSELEAGTKEATDAVNAEVARLGRHLDMQTVGVNISTKLSAGRQKIADEVSVLFDKIPNLKVKPTPFVLKMRRVNAEAIKGEPASDFPTEAFTLINTQINPTGRAVRDIDIQTLRGINRSLNGMIKKASKDGNGVLVHRLQILKEAFGESLDLTTKTIKGSTKDINILKKANALRTSMGNRFDKSTVADVMQRGVRGEETRIAKANIAKEFDSLDGIDNLIAATNSIPAARSMMKDYYAFKLINKAVNAEGIVSRKSALTWLGNNKDKLKKLGLLDKFNSLPKLQAEVDKRIASKDVFNKSVAGRILNADIDGMVANAYRGSKNFPQTTRELLKMVEGNKAATEGLKKAFGEFLIRRAESTAPSFFQAIKGADDVGIKFIESVSKLNKVFKDFLPSINIMYKDNPKALGAILDMWAGMRIIERTARSRSGSGLSTAELIFGANAIARGAGLVVGGVRPAQFYPFKVVNTFIQKHGQKNVEEYLTRAMFDPDYAAVMTQAAKTGKVDTPLIRRLMKNAVLLASDFPERLSRETAEERKRVIESINRRRALSR